MRAGVVVVCATGILVPVAMAAYHYTPRQVELPVYDKPVTFFEEGKQALLVGAPPAGLQGLSAEECGRCHQDQHAQWKDSAHGQASTEPVFAAAFEAEPRFVCRSCHSPLLEQQPKLVHQLRKKPKLLLHGEEGPGSVARITQHGGDSVRGAHSFITETNASYQPSLAAEGVNCAACHVREGTILTARATGSSRSPHPLSYSPTLTKASFCAGCHQFNIQDPNSHPFERQPAPQKVVDAVGKDGRPLSRMASLVKMRQLSSVTAANTAPGDCSDGDRPPVCPIPGLEEQYQTESRDQDTFAEYEGSPAALKGETCQSCHMPADKGRPGHNWPGRDSVAMLRKAISLEARLVQSTVRKGDTLEAAIELQNDAGHRFPTGDSVHAGIVDVWLKDGSKTLSRRAYVLAKEPASAPHAQVGSPNPHATFENSGTDLEALRIPPPSTFQPSNLQLSSSPRRNDTHNHREDSDTRIRAGQKARLRFRQKVTTALAAAMDPRLEVRVYYSAVHPGFKGSRIDPKLKPLRLIREAVLPVKVQRVRQASIAR